VRVARSREVVAAGYRPAVVARVAGISRQAIYKQPRRRPDGEARPRKSAAVERVIVDIAKDNPSDGYRMITAFTSRRLGQPVNRKRVLRVMRAHDLIQKRRPLNRRKRPGFFRVERPDQLWHLDMTSIWVAEHGWCYLMAAIDCCTREIVGHQLGLRGRSQEAITLVEQAVTTRGIEPGQLVLGTDNGSAFTSRAFQTKLRDLGITHRRGGYRDPESQAFIESWFGKLKQREVWQNEYETLTDAADRINLYVTAYHHRPHSLLAYRTPAEVAETWRTTQGPNKTAAETDHH
jgi:putative transposase